MNIMYDYFLGYNKKALKFLKINIKFPCKKKSRSVLKSENRIAMDLYIFMNHTISDDSEDFVIENKIFRTLYLVIDGIPETSTRWTEKEIKDYMHKLSG